MWGARGNSRLCAGDCTWVSGLPPGRRTGGVGAGRRAPPRGWPVPRPTSRTAQKARGRAGARGKGRSRGCRRPSAQGRRAPRDGGSGSCGAPAARARPGTRTVRRAPGQRALQCSLAGGVSVTSLLRRKEPPGKGAVSHTDKLRLDQAARGERSRPGAGAGSRPALNVPAGPERRTHEGCCELHAVGVLPPPRNATGKELRKNAEFLDSPAVEKASITENQNSEDIKRKD